MKKRDDFLNRVVLGIDLPGERLPGMPLIEIVGTNRVLLENHKGVIAYGNQEVKVKVSCGVVSVSGSALRLACMSKQQLIIVGRIDSVALQHRRC